MIVGQDRAIERLIVCLLARGHCLLEGVPGLAKTLAVETLATVVGRHVHPPAVHPRPAARRHRRHPHLPGVDREVRRRARPDLRQLRARRRDQPGAGQGAVGAARGHGRAPRVDRWRDLRRADPVPRARHAEPDRDRGRVPAARGAARPLPHEDRHRLPDAGRGDRDRPPDGRAPAARRPGARTSAICSRLQDLADEVYVDRGVVDYAVSLVLATREPARLPARPSSTSCSAFGASPRASLGLVAAARALALLRGRTYALPQDVFDVAPDILRHRLVLTYEALAQGLTVEHLLARLLSTVPAPRVSPSQDPAAAPTSPPTSSVPPAPPAPRPVRSRLAGAGLALRGALFMSLAEPSRSANDGLRLTSQSNRPPSIATGPSSEVLRRLELTVTRRLDGLLQGDYRGLVPGHGTEPGETRPYQPGDDVRRIDWNVTARTRRAPHPRDDRRPRARDVGAGRPLGQPRLRHRRLREARPRAGRHRRRRLPHRSARGNRIGAVVLDGETTATVPARTGRAHLQAVLHRALQAAKDDHPGAVRPRRRRSQRSRWPTRRRGLVVVVSDFLVARRLGRAAAARSALATRCSPSRSLDPRELELPDVGVLDLRRPRDRATSARSTPPTPARAQRYAEAAAAPAGRDHASRSATPAPTTCVLRTDSRLAARPGPLRRPCGASGCKHAQGCPHDLPLPRTALAPRSASSRWPRSTCSCSSGAAAVRRALHEPGPARPGRARSVPDGAATCPPRSSSSRSSTLDRRLRPAGAPRAGAARAGHHHASPSTPRCRWRPPTSRPTRIKAAQTAAKAFVQQLPVEASTSAS